LYVAPSLLQTKFLNIKTLVSNFTSVITLSYKCMLHCNLIVQKASGFDGLGQKPMLLTLLLI
jgi:hypothetical protein